MPNDFSTTNNGAQGNTSGDQNFQFGGYQCQPIQAIAVANMDAAAIKMVPKLNGKNFLAWKRSIIMVLKLKGLIEAVNNEQVDEITDINAMLTLMSTMNDEHKLQVQSEPNAKAMMRNVERQYADSSAASKHRLISDFFTLKKESEISVMQHLAILKEKRTALENMGEKFSDDLFQVVIINSLTTATELMKEWEMIHPSMKNLEFLTSVLHTREKESAAPGTLALYVRNNNKTQIQRPRMTIEGKKRKFPCSLCKKLGHWISECPDKAQSRNEANESKKEINETLKQLANMILNTGLIGNELKNKWVIDSNATDHMWNKLYSC